MSERSQTDPWPGLSGRLTGEGHILPVRVYFEDTDFSGLVYHASYFRWCERGRSDYLRLLGVQHSELAAGAIGGEPCAFAVRRITADFLKPARIDDILEVQTSASGITRASVAMRASITRGGRPIFRLDAQCVLVSLSGRLMRFPAHLFSRLPGANP